MHRLPLLSFSAAMVAAGIAFAAPAHAQSVGEVLEGAAIGAGGGAVVGAVVPGVSVGEGAIVGGVGGAAIGAINGSNNDNDRKWHRDRKGRKYWVDRRGRRHYRR